MHALQGHLMSLPFMDLLIEGLEEIAESTKGTEALLEELEAEESKDYKQFFEAPLPMQTVNFKKQFENLMKTEGLLETILKDPSVCRTSLVPSQTRYLGLSTNSDKIGGPQVGWNETYDLGIPLFVTNGVYSWEEGNEPIPGIVQQTSKLQDRQTSEEWQEECPAVTMPDYKDWLYGPLKDGKTKLTFPNEKEKAYYGYDPSKFKGIVGIVPTIWTENHCKKCPETDIRLTRFPEHVTTTVNGKVANFRFFNSMAILEDEAGSIYWDPSENQDYVIEFEPHGEIDGFPAVEHHLRFYGVLLKLGMEWQNMILVIDSGWDDHHVDIHTADRNKTINRLQMIIAITLAQSVHSSSMDQIPRASCFNIFDFVCVKKQPMLFLLNNPKNAELLLVKKQRFPGRTIQSFAMQLAMKFNMKSRLPTTGKLERVFLRHRFMESYHQNFVLLA
eukprot:scaffold3720_cov141-Cylindrotheca_fusiformis.AAC.3